MNLILFEPHESIEHLPGTDPRAVHIIKVLRGQVGDVVRIGTVGGGSGTATIVSLDRTGVGLSMSEWTETAWRPDVSLRLVLGHPRPLVAKRLFKDLASLAVDRVSLFDSDLGERSYRQSSVWNNTRDYLLEGASQGGHTCLPVVDRYQSLAAAVSETHDHGSLRFAGDLADSDRRLSIAEMLQTIARQWEGGESSLPILPVELLVGSERGLSVRENEVAQSNGFIPVSLGPTILRTEVAATSICTVVRSLE